MAVKKITIVTEKCILQNNHLKPGQFKLMPQLKRTIGIINEYVRFVQIEVLIENKEEMPFPTNMDVVVKAIVEFNQDSSSFEMDEYMKEDAVDYLYPYVRSMVSSLATTAMFPPIVLPIAKARDIFKDNHTITYS